MWTVRVFVAGNTKDGKVSLLGRIGIYTDEQVIIRTLL